MVSVVRLPIELKDGWKPSNCTVEKTVLDDVYAVVAHDIQFTVALGSEKECWEFLGREYGDRDIYSR